MTTSGKVMRDLDMPRLTRGVKRVSGCQVRAVSEAAFFDSATVKNSKRNSEVKSWSAPCGDLLAMAAHRKGAQIEDLELFLRGPQTRCGHIFVQCGQNECLREGAPSTADMLGMPTGVTPEEQSQTNGHAEQRVGGRCVTDFTSLWKP